MQRPDLTVEYKLGDETRKVKWTYGLSNDIQRLVPTMEESIPTFMSRPDIRDYILRRCLTEKKGFVKDEDELVSAEVIDEIDPAEVLKILDWVLGHLMYFFATSAESTHRRATEFKTALEQFNPSTSGSQNSASQTPVAGPST